jgi:hypothetical protein
MLDFGSFELQQGDRGSLDVRLEEVHRAVVVVIEGGLMSARCSAARSRCGSPDEDRAW